MFLDEARLAARMRHPNVVPTLDVVATEGELFLVMEYVARRVARAPAARGARGRRARAGCRIAVAIMLRRAPRPARRARGDAASTASRSASCTATCRRRTSSSAPTASRACSTSASRRPRAASRRRATGQLKGKLAYMAPEQLARRGGHAPGGRLRGVGRALGGAHRRAPLRGDSEGGLVTSVLLGKVRAPSKAVAEPPRPADDDGTTHAIERLDATVLRGLERDPAKRFESAREMALAIEQCVQPATAAQVGRVARARRGAGARGPGRARRGCGERWERTRAAGAVERAGRGADAGVEHLGCDERERRGRGGRASGRAARDDRARRGRGAGDRRRDAHRPRGARALRGWRLAAGGGREQLDDDSSERRRHVIRGHPARPIVRTGSDRIGGDTLVPGHDAGRSATTRSSARETRVPTQRLQPALHLGRAREEALQGTVPLRAWGVTASHWPPSCTEWSARSTRRRQTPGALRGP